MARVALLTRPLPVYDGIAQALDAAGMSTLSIPTLNVTPYIDPCESEILNQSYNGVMCVSQHAVAFATQRLTRLQKSIQPEWFAAVGQATGQAINNHWPQTKLITPLPNDSQDTNGLWRALEQSVLLTPNHHILIIRATIGRDTLQQHFVNAQLRVKIWACYERNVTVWSDEQQKQAHTALQNAGLVILLTSAEGLRGLIANIQPMTAAWLEQPVVTLHPVIAKAAHQYGFKHVICVAPHQISEALLAQQL